MVAAMLLRGKNSSSNIINSYEALIAKQILIIITVSNLPLFNTDFLTNFSLTKIAATNSGANYLIHHCNFYEDLTYMQL